MDLTTRLLTMGASGSGSAPTYVEDVFSTWLYTGNNSTQSITNGIDLSGKGGLVWIKSRSASGAGDNHTLRTEGLSGLQFTNTTSAAQGSASDLITLTSSGFNVNTAYSGGTWYYTNGPSIPYASWTFRKAAKFFDVVTYTGNGSTQTINHNLGSAPGVIIVKRTDATSNWIVYHRSLSSIHQYLVFNLTSAVGGSAGSSPYPWGANAPTSSQFTVGDNGIISSAFKTNASGGTYVAYLFAHDAGGFGDSGNDSVVKCGSFTNDGSGNATVDLGWEPQWLLVKRTDNTSNWWIIDTQRGWGVVNRPELYANTSGAEVANADSLFQVTSTGFRTVGWDALNSTYIYIAIRRGPMKTPTDATKVFTSVAATSSGTFTATAGFPVDLDFYGVRSSGDKWFWFDRVRGNPYISSNLTNAETASVGRFDSQTSFYLSGVTGNYSDYQNYAFRRAPGFFDVVAYTGTGANRTVSHNLGVAPELMIVKNRTTNGRVWAVYSQYVGATRYLRLETNISQSGVDSRMWNSTAPTAAVFTVGDYADVNASGGNMIAYLFASCPGVSKCFNYTGTGTTLQINCGFTNGARFVMIKRTDSTGDWYVWDSARGIISGNDPYLLLNSTAAEVTNTDYIDPYSAGFEISSTAPAAINANGGSYIGLAIA